MGEEVELCTTEEKQAILFEQSDVCGTIDDDDDKADDAIASKVESQSVHVIHSVLKLQNSVDKEPEQKTDIEMIPTLSCRPKVNQKDNNDLTMVVSNEDIHTENLTRIRAITMERYVLIQYGYN